MEALGSGCAVGDGLGACVGVWVGVGGTGEGLGVGGSVVAADPGGNNVGVVVESDAGAAESPSQAASVTAKLRVKPRAKPRVLIPNRSLRDIPRWETSRMTWREPSQL